ncbi:MAG TPA: nitroreductase family protein [Methanoregulaceae archaeon]|nr:nitroreductase family protein [Methanoregulaceae archaeon]
MTIKVDPDTCNLCAICSEVCPMAIIDPGEGETLPVIRGEKTGMCISCGQCEAFCPTGALVQESGNIQRSHPEKEMDEKGKMSPEQLSIYVKSRRSIRQYLPEPVDRETITSILDIARYAPSGGNRQPVEWLVIHDPWKVQEVAALTMDWMEELAESNHPMSSYAPHLIEAYKNGSDVICRGAPNLLVPHIPGDNQLAPIDAIIALTHVDITAPSFGVGTCWAGFVAMASKMHKPLLDYYDLPEGRVPAYAMMLGYPKYRPKHIPGRKPLKIRWK